LNLSHPGTPGLRCSAPSWGLIVGHPLMPFSQATAGMPGTDAARKPQHARQLDVNLFSDVKKLRLRDRNLTSEKILTCYRPDPAPEGRAASRPATPQAKRHWVIRVSGPAAQPRIPNLAPGSSGGTRSRPGHPGRQGDTRAAPGRRSAGARLPESVTESGKVFPAAQMGRTGMKVGIHDHALTRGARP